MKTEQKVHLYTIAAKVFGPTALTALLTIVTPTALAQQGVPNYNNLANSAFAQAPTIPNFTDVTANLDSAANTCKGKNIVDSISGAFTTAVATTTSKGLSGVTSKCSGVKGIKDGIGTVESACKMEIPDLPAVSCGDFAAAKKPCNDKNDSNCDKAADYDTAKKQFDLNDNWKAVKSGCYEALAAFKEGTCADQGMDELNAAMDTINCQMRALSAGVSAAQSQVQKAFSANQAQYQKMVATENEITDQRKQIDAILGPDPTLPGAASYGKTKGLLALQADVKASVQAWKTSEGQMTTQITQIKADYQKNDQQLSADSMVVVGQCMNGERNITNSGGQALICYKQRMVPGPPATPGGPPGPSTAAIGNNGRPIYDKQPCGPLEYLRSQVEQSAYTTNSGGVMVNSSRSDAAQAKTAELDGMMQAILRDMGALPGQTDDQAGLQSQVSSIQGFNAKYQSQLNKLSTDLNMPGLAGNISSVVNHCFGESQNWVNQQKTSANSKYNVAKKKIDDGNTQLIATIQNGLTDQNQMYSDVMAALGGQHVALNRFSCTQTDLDKMETCFKTVEANMQDLLEGGSDATLTAKQITGGQYTQSFSIPCKGLNGCITALTQVRTQQNNAISAVQKNRVKWANDGNSQITSALSSLIGAGGGTQNSYGMGGNTLNSLQASVLTTFGNVQSIMAKYNLGKPPESPKYAAAESLTQMDGPNGEKGPYATPKSMQGVLSSMMQPGLIDLQSSGIMDALNTAKDKVEEKAKEFKDEAKTIRESVEKYSKVNSELQAGNCDGMQDFKDAVAAHNAAKRDDIANDACNNCEKDVNSCLFATAQASPSSGNYVVKDDSLKSLQDALDAALEISKGSTDKTIKQSDLTAALQKIQSDHGVLASDCINVNNTCNQCTINEKNGVYTGKHGSDGNSSTQTAE